MMAELAQTGLANLSRSAALGELRDYTLPPVPNDHLSLRDLVRLLQRHKLLVIFIVASVTLGVLAYQLLSPNQYRSVSQIQVQLIDEVGTNQADVNSRNEQRVANAVRLHRSRSSADAVVRDLDLLDNRAFMKEMGNPEASKAALRQMAITQLLTMVDVTNESGSDLIQLAVTSQNPELAALIANQYPESVSDVRNTNSNERREELMTSLRAEQKDRAEKARLASEKLAEFRRDARMLVGAGSQEDLLQVNRIGAEAASARANSAGSASRSAVVSRAANFHSTAQATSASLQQLQQQEAQLVAEKARLGSLYGPNHPDMVRVTAELSTVEGAILNARNEAVRAAQSVAQADGAQMAELARSQAAQDAARASRLEGSLAALTSKAFQNNANSVQLAELERAALLAETAYASIAERIEQIQAQMQLEGVNTMLVSPAVANYDRISPKPLTFTITAFLGSALLASLVALGIDLLDDRLRTAAQIRRLFRLPTLGMVPLIEGNLTGVIEDSPVIRDPQSMFAEAVRSTYSELRSLPRNYHPQTVMVTSPLPGDGKSTVSLSLAAAAIAMGDKAILVDLDLRRPGLLQKLQGEMDTPDIVDVINGRVELDNILEDHTARPLIEGPRGLSEVEPTGRLVLLSAKRPVRDPAAILTAARLNALILQLREKFDLIVINAPATLAVRDARAMCDLADHTVVVSRWGKTTIDQMKATLESLGGRTDGVIFDQVDYAEHARRQLGDPIQYYMESSSYYSDVAPPRRSMFGQFRRLFGRSPEPVME
ncbi:MAG: Wzz/FepE/Etk N-terminal domain-containing protein [Allopontixanthobacter sediminis]